jgi:hypothetical protein
VRSVEICWRDRVEWAYQSFMKGVVIWRNANFKLK